MPLTEKDQALMGRLLLAVAVLAVRSNPAVRGQVIAVLTRDHEAELVNAVVRKAA